MSIFGHLSLKDFFQNYWRKKPLYIKGGAKNFWNCPPTSQQFSEIIHKLEKCPCSMGSDHIARDHDEVIFAKHLNHAFSENDSNIENLKKIFKWPNISIDGVKANNDRSIGSHFDHSDNFVLNLEGKKIWRLHAPNFLPKDQLNQRLRDFPNIGYAPMPKNCIEIILEAGDLLYIPLMWVHWGVSSGASYSISVVLNVFSPAKKLMPTVTENICHINQWNDPIPRLNSKDEQRNYFDTLYSEMLKKFNDDSVKQNIYEQWENDLAINDYLDSNNINLIKNT